MDPTLPTLEARRLRLRPFGAADVDELVALYADPEVIRFMAGPRVRDADDARSLLAEIDAHARHRTLFQWAVARRGDDRLLGSVTLAELQWSHRRAEIGFALTPAHRGRGLMGEAVARLLDHAFEGLGLHRVEADVDPRNEPSLRLLERLGFRREGWLRERYRQGDEWQHSVFLGLLEGEWRERAARPPGGGRR